MKFYLVGNISWSTGSCHDDRSEPIEKWITAPTSEGAVRQSQAIIRELHTKYGHRTDYKLKATLFPIGSAIWSAESQPEQLARPAIPEQPAVTAHLEERLL